MKKDFKFFVLSCLNKFINSVNDCDTLYLKHIKGFSVYLELSKNKGKVYINFILKNDYLDYDNKKIHIGNLESEDLTESLADEVIRQLNKIHEHKLKYKVKMFEDYLSLFSFICKKVYRKISIDNNYISFDKEKDFNELYLLYEDESAKMYLINTKGSDFIKIILINGKTLNKEIVIYLHNSQVEIVEKLNSFLGDVFVND